jgi:hypothetical protein
LRGGFIRVSGTKFFDPALRESWVQVKAAMLVRDPVSQQESCNRTCHK